jgi:Family of unknown function (DUF5694)
MTTTRLLTLCFVETLLCHVAHAQIAPVAPAPPRSCTAQAATILIVGTYHMDNPGLDAVNLDADDVLRPRRQREISELVDRLARYQPTKIAIEAPYRNSTWTERYTRYLAGQYQLGRNEIEQIGFQLAKRVKLPTLYPVDFSLMMSGLTPAEIEYPAPTPTPAGDAKPAEAAPLSERDLLLRRSTITEFLRYLNRDETIRADHAQYMEMFLPSDDAAIYGSTDRVTNWYKRNFRIFANINRVTTFPGDRVLLIIGAGHLKILKDLAANAPYFCLADVDSYLK